MLVMIRILLKISESFLFLFLFSAISFLMSLMLVAAGLIMNIIVDNP